MHHLDFGFGNFRFQMLVLVANLGSTSFKYKLLDMSKPNGEVVARGGYERIGQKDSPYKSHSDVIDVILAELRASGVKV